MRLSELSDRYERWLAGLPLSQRTRREYARQVSRFGEWLAGEGDRGEEAARGPGRPRLRGPGLQAASDHLTLTEAVRRGEYRPLKTSELAQLASA